MEINGEILAAADGSKTKFSGGIARTNGSRDNAIKRTVDVFNIENTATDSAPISGKVAVAV